MHGASKSESNLNAGEIRLLLLYAAPPIPGMDNGVKITALVIVSPLSRLRFILTFGSEPSPEPQGKGLKSMVCFKCESKKTYL